MSFIRLFIDDVVDFLHEQPTWSLVYFIVFYLGCTLTASRLKDFWYDELFTYHMSRLPDWKTIVSALKAGADLNPPPIYFFTRISHAVFGTGEIATRLPATLGFLLMLLCLYRIVAIRMNRPVAYSAIFFPLVTGAYRWATEARTYGVILGLAAAAVMFWQQAGRVRENRALACVGLGLCLTLAITTQAYGVLCAGPMLVGEGFRVWRSREIRWPVWMALLLPLCALAAYIPLLPAHNSVLLDNSVFRPEPASIARFYHLLLDPSLFPLLIVFAICLWPGSRSNSDVQEELSIPIEEYAMATGFLLIPVASILVALAVTRVFMDRYGLPSIIGATLLFALLLARSGNRRAPVYTVAVFGFWCVAGVMRMPGSAQDGLVRADTQRLDDIRPELPLVVSNGLWFLPMSHYSEPALAARLTYLIDRKSAVQFTGSNVFDVGYPILKQWYNIRGNIVPYDDFVKRNSPFLLYGPTPFPLDWVVKKLIADGATVKVIAIRPETFLCEVIPPAHGR
ncbi:MAG: glycosyltransferase family 39 protein [Acidobacteria bacterium]|nr:glycosyltransferase family 39 protein [Acidobacteriota bacterium]